MLEFYSDLSNSNLGLEVLFIHLEFIFLYPTPLEFLVLYEISTTISLLYLIYQDILSDHKERGTRLDVLRDMIH